MNCLPLEVFVLEEDVLMNLHSDYSAVGAAYTKADADAWVGRAPDRRRARALPVYMRAFGAIDQHAQSVLGPCQGGR